MNLTPMNFPKKRFGILLPIALLTVLGSLGTASARRPAPPDVGPDRSGSPYFFIPNGDPSIDALPLKETRADVTISGTIAHVRVTQVYKNDGRKPIEAIYVFPGSTRAAVFAMRMTIGDRVIAAEIQKKAEARAMYEEAKREGKTASLLEQERPNVFQMNVANILPGDTIRVEMDYAEGLISEDGAYQFVYPAVVGPRFTGESNETEGYTETPYTHSGEKPTYGWDLSVRLAAGMKIKRVSSTSHPIATTFTTGDIADITLSNKGAAGTKDFVLDYQLTGETIDTGVLLYEGRDGEKFFLAMVEPPARVEARMKPRREYVFIVDVSGSMHGFPIETAKHVMNGLLDTMNENDRFNILCFSGGNQVLAPESLAVTPDNVAEARAFMDRMSGGGGTEILGALREALAMKTPEGYARTFVAVTDGYVSVEPQVFSTIRKNLGNANFFAFGIGSSVNRHLIEGMARMGLGAPFFVMEGQDDSKEMAKKFERYIDSPVLTDIKVGFEGFNAYDVEPAAVPDLFASRPVMVFGKYKGEAKGRIVLTGVSGAGRFEQRLEVSKYRPTGSNEALRYLWARHRITTLSDLQPYEPSEKNVAEITELGLTYNLMTEYTSFIAVDQRVRTEGGKTVTVKQPLPLPDGVSDLAVPEQAFYAPSKRVRAEMKMMAPPSPQSREGGPKSAIDEESSVRVSMQIGRVTIKNGPLSESEVRRVTVLHKPRMARCLEQNSVSGGAKVEVSLVIDASGAVQKVAFGAEVSSVIRTCLERIFKQMRFASSASGTTVASIVVEL